MFKRLFTIVLLAGFFVVNAGMGQAPKGGKVHVQTQRDRHYRLIVDGRPYVVKGVCYNPIPIGKSHDHDFWNDPNEPWLVDGALMQKMGINTVRFYQPGDDIEATKRVIRVLYEKFGIRTIMGHWLGFWSYPAPFYDDEDFRERTKKEVLAMVEALKEEEGILFWCLGNENNYSFGGKINAWSSERIDKMKDPRRCLLTRASVYYSFVNDVAKSIHKVDPDHPVAMGNGETVCLDVAREFAPDVDILGVIMYRGKTFGNIFHSLRSTYDKPVVFVEFGADAYNAYEKTEDEDMQAFFLKSQWKEVAANLAGKKKGAGNCLGGVLFEWTDEWWKHEEWNRAAASLHDTESNWSNAAYYKDIKADRNMNMNEEWFGIVRLSEEQEDGMDKRTPRKGYYEIREFWRSMKR